MNVHPEPFGPRARQRLAALVAEAKGTDPLAPVTVVAPSQYAGLSLRRRLALENGANGLLNVRFMVLPRLAEYLGGPKLAALGKRPLSPLVEMAAIRAATAQSAKQGLLAASAEHPALHLALRDTFRDLDRLSAQDLLFLSSAETVGAVHKTPPPPNLPGRGHLTGEVVSCYRAFRERTQAFYRQEELAAAASAAILTGEAASALRDVGAVVLYLVHDLSPVEERLVAALGTQGICSLVVGLTGEADVDAPVWSLAARFGVTLPTAQQEHPSEGYSPVTTGAAPFPGEARILSASDAREEVRWIVRRMLALARKGVPFHQMAAVYRQLDPYAFHLRTELTLAGVPLAGPQPLRLRDTPTGRLLSGLLNIITSDFGRAEVMQWVAETPVRTGRGRDVASAELPRWDEISRRAGVVAGLAQWQERLGRYRAGLEARAAHLTSQEEGTPAQLWGLRENAERAGRLLAFITGLSLAKPPAEGSPWRAFAKWARVLLKMYAHEPKRWPQEHQAAHEGVLSLLDGLGELDAVDSGATFGHFRAALSDALEASTGRLGATGSGVFVGSLGAAYGMEFEAVWVLGMVDGSFPSRPADDPLLPDALREQVNAGLPHGALLPLRRAGSLGERRSYLVALASAPRVTLSYTRTDSTARRSQHPAPWLLDAAAAHHGQPVSSGQLSRIKASWLAVVESPEHALGDSASIGAADRHEFDLASIAAWKHAGERVERHPLAAEGQTLGRALRLERARRSDPLTAWDGLLATAAPGSARLGKTLTGVMSATRLERWARCPFQFFLGDVLSLAALETPEELLSISAMDRGDVIHRILERFFREVITIGNVPPAGGPWQYSHEALLDSIADDEFDKAEQRGITGRPLLWESSKEDIRQDLKTFLEKEPQWRAETGAQPVHVEWAFGIDTPPASLPLPDGSTVHFRGLVDRIDLAPGLKRARVIDYKTGSAYPYEGMRAGDFLTSGTHLQLPVYALAVRSAVPAAQAVDAEYWFISSKGRFDRISVPLAQVEQQFKDTVMAIVGGIRGGVFPANPGGPGPDGPSNCTFCDFNRLCPTNRAHAWERKRGRPEAAPYTRLMRQPGANPSSSVTP